MERMRRWLDAISGISRAYEFLLLLVSTRFLFTTDLALASSRGAFLMVRRFFGARRHAGG